jgi:hypothetical protein
VIYQLSQGECRHDWAPEHHCVGAIFRASSKASRISQAKLRTSAVRSSRKLPVRPLELNWASHAPAKSGMRHFDGRRVSLTVTVVFPVLVRWLPWPGSSIALLFPAPVQTPEEGAPPPLLLLHIKGDDDVDSTHLQTPTVSLASNSPPSLNTRMSTAVPDPNLQSPLLAKSAASDVRHSNDRYAITLRL